MKLVELNPMFVATGGPGVTSSATGEPVPKTEGVGVLFDCPCGNHAEDHRCYVPFSNPIGPGPYTGPKGWERTGETFETLTLSPSILRRADWGGCGWHGFIRNGEVITV